MLDPALLNLYSKKVLSAALPTSNEFVVIGQDVYEASAKEDGWFDFGIGAQLNELSPFAEVVIYSFTDAIAYRVSNNN